MDKWLWSLYDNLEQFTLGDTAAHPEIWQERKALYLEQGRAVLLEQAFGYSCYRLEAEIACPGPGGFIGLIFAARDPDNYELVYVSPPNAGNAYLGEIQYDPCMKGSYTWQIYNGPAYQVPGALLPGVWSRLIVEVRGSSASVFVGDAPSPQLVIRRLQLGHPAGRIGVWGYGPGYIRNLSIEELDVEEGTDATEAATPAAVREALAAGGFITEWKVSGAYREDEPPHSWSQVPVEENGTLNLNRLYPSPEGTAVLAEYKFALPKAQSGRLIFGFSDHLRLWINDEEVFKGSRLWNPPLADGRIRADEAEILVAWRSGMNTIRAEIKVGEAYFGWGLTMKMSLAD